MTAGRRAARAASPGAGAARPGARRLGCSAGRPPGGRSSGRPHRSASRGPRLGSSLRRKPNAKTPRPRAHLVRV
ncbi:MAG: hypothetical protein DMF85_17025 [Acidobacteria bacterium]|nr:MAG: hypothetical protein DMF85_17025 [Acidobacteriota bacterium]